MLKEKKAPKDNPATTPEDIEKQIASNHRKISHYHQSIMHAQDEIDSLRALREQRERALASKQNLLEDAKKALHDAKSYGAFTSPEHMAHDVAAKQKEIDEIDSEIAALSNNHAKITREDDTLIEAINASIHEQNAIIAELENSNASLHIQKRDMHDAEGQQCYQELDKNIQGCKERLTSIVSAEKAARDAYKSTRHELAQLVEQSIPKLANWPELQAKLKRENTYNDSPVRALEAYIRLLQLIIREAKAINDYTGISTYSLLNELSIERNELEILSSGYEAPFKMQEKLETAESYYKLLTKK